jgi:hypothetical protein
MRARGIALAVTRYANEQVAAETAQSERRSRAAADREAAAWNESATLVNGLVDALTALQDPEGHIPHGSDPTVCTGECKAVRAALAAARGEEAPRA